jgi:hypothetical protein
MRDIQNILFDSQMATLKNLESRIKSLQEQLKLLQKKISKDGVNGYYSFNSDCMRLSSEVWSACHRLGELKKIEMLFSNSNEKESEE